MQTNPLPEVENTEIETVRRFLTSVREEERPTRIAQIPLVLKSGVTVRNGITRARTRSLAKSEA